MIQNESSIKSIFTLDHQVGNNIFDATGYINQSIKSLQNFQLWNDSATNKNAKIYLPRLQFQLGDQSMHKSTYQSTKLDQRSIKFNLHLRPRHFKSIQKRTNIQNQFYNKINNHSAPRSGIIQTLQTKQLNCQSNLILKQQNSEITIWNLKFQIANFSRIKMN